jgi:predicted Rossmann fold nucleotide-binding protein DprA/Smf involved in DNA uptake
MLDSNTEATLLLCGRFGKPKESGVSPLEPREYNRLEGWLAARDLSVAELLDLLPNALAEPNLPVAAERLNALLARGAALALAVESWESNGLWVMSRHDERYPPRLRGLGTQAPPLLYGAGDPDLLMGSGMALAVVGSRDVAEKELELAQEVARACAREGIALVSGGARGIDSQAMGAALERGGTVIGVLADSLARAAVVPDHREALLDGRLTLVSPNDPGSGFNVGNAMGRNKYVYALADAALVVCASPGMGGTWTGATEALKKGRTPVFVWLGEDPSEGNLKLVEKGAQVFPEEAVGNLSEWLAMLSRGANSREGMAANGNNEAAVMQGTLF